MISEARTGLKFEDTLQRGVGELVLNNLTNITIEAVATEKRSKGRDMNLYVHIPFCTEICSFCAFHR